MVCARKKVASLLGATVYIQPVTSAMMRHAIHSPIRVPSILVSAGCELNIATYCPTNCLKQLKESLVLFV